jgi:ERCC4-type nuclease
MLAGTNSKARPSKSPGVSPKLQPPAASEVEPVIVIDSREQEPLSFSRFRTVAGTLKTGDYSILGLESMFSIERKSLADLVSCCCAGNRQRFERELHRLRGYRFKRLLIVGSEEDILAGRYRSAINPKAVLASLFAFEARYDLPVVFRSTTEDAARQIERWAYWFSREIFRASNNLTKSSRSEHPRRAKELVTPTGLAPVRSGPVELDENNDPKGLTF